MASQKQKKSLSKSKLDIMSSTLTKGEPIRRKHKAIVAILCAMVITIATTSVVHMVKVQQANQNKLEQLIKENTKDQQVQLKKQNEETQNKQQQLEQQIEELRKQVKAKKESKIAEAIKPVQVAQAANAPTGSCQDWMIAAGVTDIANAYTIIMRESGCNPNAVNKSSGACGIPQALPCSKLGTKDPVEQIRWMQNYVNNRYGGWAGAVAFWNTHHWY